MCLYRVGIALLGEEELAALTKFLLHRFEGEQSIEVRLISCSRLGTQDTSQALSLLLAGTPCSADLNGHIGIREVYTEITHLREHEGVQLP